MNIKPKISIIVPIYNAEKHLCKCIESILSQTFTDFELLLINDGSKDHSGQICEDFARKDIRVKVFHQSNEGVSSARNKGLDNSCGQYICFIDADDWVEQEYLNAFFTDALQEDEFLFVVQNIFQENKNNTLIFFEFPDKIFNQNEFEVLFWHVRLINFGAPFAKLYSLDIIKKYSIYFDEHLSCGEDLLFMLKYLKYINNINMLSKSYYHYRYSSVYSLSQLYNSFEQEYYLFLEIKKRLIEIYILFNMHKYTLKNINERIGGFLVRSIHSMYMSKNKKKYFERILILKNINTIENIICINSFQRKQNSFFEKISTFLFNNKFYFLFDLYSNFRFTVKRLLSTLCFRICLQKLGSAFQALRNHQLSPR